MGREMIAGLTSRVLDDFLGCFSEMREDLTRWTKMVPAFRRSVEIAKGAIMVGKGESLLAIKFRIVAGVIAEMYRSSVDKQARMTACDALIQLDTFVVATCHCRALDVFRLNEIKDQDRKDRGVRTLRARPAARLALVLV